MKNRFIVFGIITSLLTAISWYYIIIFCGVYQSSSVGWIQGSLLSLAIDWLGFEFILPILMAAIRELIRCSPKLMFLENLSTGLNFFRMLLRH
jgi:hypothetical protein